MASQSVSKIPFLVFPAPTAFFSWKVVSTQSNRTVSRHRILRNAVRKAASLNEAALPDPFFGRILEAIDKAYSRQKPSTDRGTCDSWLASSDSDIGEHCFNPASVGDLDSGRDFCAACWRSL